MTPTLTFTCSICGEPSGDICIYCTKDACSNHVCEKCHKCSDCCECEVRLEERSEVVAAVVAPLVAEVSVNAEVEETAPVVVPVDGSAPLVETAEPAVENPAPPVESAEPVVAENPAPTVESPLPIPAPAPAAPRMPVFAEEPSTPRIPSFTGLWAPETPARVFPGTLKPPTATAGGAESTTIEPTGARSVDPPIEGQSLEDSDAEDVEPAETSEHPGDIDDERPGHEHRSEPVE